MRAGDGVPGDELGRVPGGDSADVRVVPVGAPRGLSEGHSYFMPRVGFAYSPSEVVWRLEGGALTREER